MATPKSVFGIQGTTNKSEYERIFSKYPVLNQGQLVGLAGKGVSTDRILVQDISFDGHKLGRHEVMRLPKTLGVPFTAGIRFIPKATIFT